MYDILLASEILKQMHWSARLILQRFKSIESPDDFLASDEGLEKLDAICMQLIALGESTKNLDKVTLGQLLSRHPEIEWKRVMGMRDVISHHYFDVDAEVVYSVCVDHIPRLIIVLQCILHKMSEENT